jgi:hypothetical protein
MKPLAEKVRRNWTDVHVAKIIERTGCTADEAKRTVKGWLGGHLTSDTEIVFAEYGPVRVGDVLANPKKYAGKYLADPLEGVSYGTTTAWLNQREDGLFFVYSHAHGGGGIFELDHDYKSIEAAIRSCKAEEADECFVRLYKCSSLRPLEEDRLFKLARELSGVSYHALKTALKQAKSEQRQYRFPNQETDEHWHYGIIGGELHWLKPGAVPVRLCNFGAHITEERNLDDGVNITKQYSIKGALKNGTALPLINVAVEKSSLAKWWRSHWTDAIVVPDIGEKHLIPALQSLSAPVPQHTVYAHLGWRKVGEQCLYFHANGAIGADGPVPGFNVEPGGQLTHFILPVVTDLIAAIRASLLFIDIGPIGIAVVAAVYRAPLGEFCNISSSLFLEGSSGVFKSALVGVAQAHWGSHWDGKSFPANWSSTANALEKIAFIAKDVVIVVDDFAPKGSGYDVQRAHAQADQLLRAQGNLGGRGRMNADGTLRPTFWPRGLIVATGEDVPIGQSLRARMNIVPVVKGSIDPNKLAVLQDFAAKGVLAEAMAGYVQYLASGANGLSAALAGRMLRLRDEANVGGHARNPDNFASQMLGIECLLDFAEHAGAISAVEKSDYRSRAAAGLTVLATEQVREQADEKPVELFRRMIEAALRGGRGHLATKDGVAPPNFEAACGWRMDWGLMSGWKPVGERLGWIEGDDLWLNPTIAYACAERLCRDQNRSLGLTERTLGKRLAEAGWLKSNEGGKQSQKLRAEGGFERGYHLSVKQFLPNLQRRDDPASPSAHHN